MEQQPKRARQTIQRPRLWVRERAMGVEDYYQAASNLSNFELLQKKIAGFHVDAGEPINVTFTLGSNTIQTPAEREAEWELNWDMEDYAKVRTADGIRGAMAVAMTSVADSPVNAVDLGVTAMCAAIKAGDRKLLACLAGDFAMALMSFEDTTVSAYVWFLRAAPRDNSDFYYEMANACFAVNKTERGRNALLNCAMISGKIEEHVRILYGNSGLVNEDPVLPKCPTALMERLKTLETDYQKAEHVWFDREEFYAELYQRLRKFRQNPYCLSKKLDTINEKFLNGENGTIVFCGTQNVFKAKLINRLIGKPLIPFDEQTSYTCNVEVSTYTLAKFIVQTNCGKKAEFDNVYDAHEYIDTLFDTCGHLGYDDLHTIYVVGPFELLPPNKKFRFVTNLLRATEIIGLDPGTLRHEAVVVVENARNGTLTGPSYAFYARDEDTPTHLCYCNATGKEKVVVSQGQCFLVNFEKPYIIDSTPGFIQLKNELDRPSREHVEVCIKALQALRMEATMTGSVGKFMTATGLTSHYI